jgi:hypothetical protein
MATRTIVQLTDDTDGKPAAETVRLSLDGRNFEIDLSERNAKALRKDLAPWLAAARRVPGTRANGTTRVETGVDSAAVRAWAASNGIELSPEAASQATSSTSTEPPATDLRTSAGVARHSNTVPAGAAEPGVWRSGDPGPAGKLVERRDV